MSGKYTEYGMSYQKRVLMFCSICKSNSYDAFQYEGGDDVVCINNEENRKMFIQAKTGSLSHDDKLNVFYNWIKLKPTKNDTFMLISTKNYKIDLKVLKDNILSSLRNAKDSDNLSNIKQAYISCCENGVYSEEKANNFLSIINERFSFKGKTSDEDLDSQIFDYYKREKIHDNKYIDSQIHRHIEYISKELLHYIDENIENSTHQGTDIIIITSLIDKWIDAAKQMYGVDRYNRRRFEFNSDISQPFDDTKREVSQLKRLGLQDSFIADCLINEVFYKDFRDYYIDSNETDVCSIELKAFNNYSLKSLGIDLNNVDLCRNLFKEVYSELINDPLILSMADGTFCSQGCYIYLTGDEIKQSNQITWIKTDE